MKSVRAVAGQGTNTSYTTRKVLNDNVVLKGSRDSTVSETAYYKGTDVIVEGERKGANVRAMWREDENEQITVRGKARRGRGEVRALVDIFQITRTLVICYEPVTASAGRDNNCFRVEGYWTCWLGGGV